MRSSWKHKWFWVFVSVWSAFFKWPCSISWSSEHASLAFSLNNWARNDLYCRGIDRFRSRDKPWQTTGGSQTMITWWRHDMERLPRYWAFVRGIHLSQVDFPSQRPSKAGFDVFKLLHSTICWRKKRVGCVIMFHNAQLTSLITLTELGELELRDGYCKDIVLGKQIYRTFSFMYHCSSISWNDA